MGFAEKLASLSTQVSVLHVAMTTLLVLVPWNTSHAGECSDTIHDHPRLSDERVAQLDASDAALARVARHQGHSRPLAMIAGPARGPKQVL